MSDTNNERAVNGDDGGAPQTWVKFEDEKDTEKKDGGTDEKPAVIEPTVEICSPKNANNSSKMNNSAPTTSSPNHISNHSKSVKSNLNSTNQGSSSTFQNVELQGSNLSLNSNENNGRSNNRLGGRKVNNTGFTNGDVIVSILPVNTRWPWITPASFRPELVPEELMAPGLTLTVEEYVHAMEMLSSDFRFNAYTICYKRLLAAWLAAAFCILLIILFSGVGGIHLFALGISWLVINAAAVFLCMYIKIKINQGLERCIARVNKLLVRHKLILGLDDRGQISCHKVHLCFIYFDPNECIKRLTQVLDGSQDRQRLQRHLDSQDVEIVITGAQSTTRVPQKQQKGEKIFLRYIQRWAKDFLRRRLDWTISEGGENPSAPRHITSALCPCQYVEEYLKHKPVSNGEPAWSWWLPCYNIPQSSSPPYTTNP